MKGIYFIDKPAGWTSFDVVAKVRSELSKKEGKKIKVGHAGTLDPFATGLLIVLAGEETKKQSQYMKLDKEYEATLKFGFTSSTGDPEGEITAISKRRPSIDEINAALGEFVGGITQIPPKFSAIKINGKKAYELARNGTKFNLKPRKVTIHFLEVLSYGYPALKIRVGCSSGTYIRTLAEDIGKKLGTGAYLTDLRRTKIGDYHIKKSILPTKLTSDKKQICEIPETLKCGGTAVIPTDTIYGIVGSATRRDTVEKIYEIKSRLPEKPFIILISDVSQLEIFDITPSRDTKETIKNYWPGRVSLILPCRKQSWRYLHRGTNKLAFRLPADKKLISLIDKTGPLVAPSANPEGYPPAQNIKEAKKYFGDQIDCYLEGGDLAGTPSKIIDLTGKVPKKIR